MKKLILLIALILGIYLTNDHLVEKNHSQTVEERPNSPPIQKGSISFVAFQDFSKSITLNGVELISSSVFEPLFENVYRNIEIHFGAIDNLTAGKLISITLPAVDFYPPKLSELKDFKITERKLVKEQYLVAKKQYQNDSLKYYQDRERRINKFQREVDALIAQYKENLTTDTDLVTALEIAEKVFNYSPFDDPKRIVVLNSDGLDSYGRKISSLQNDPIIILVNAGKNQKTSVDSVVSLRLQSVEQAISFILSK